MQTITLPKSPRVSYRNSIPTEVVTRDLSHLFTVRAYRAGYRAAEIGANTGNIRCEDVFDVIERIGSEPGLDRVDRDMVEAAAWNGFGAGLVGDEPLSDLSIAIHYD